MWTIRLIRRTRTHTHILGEGSIPGDPWWTSQTQQCWDIYIYILVSIYIYIYYYICIYIYIHILEVVGRFCDVAVAATACSNKLASGKPSGVVSKSEWAPNLMVIYGDQIKKRNNEKSLDFCGCHILTSAWKKKMNLYIEWKHSISVPTWHIHKSGVYTLNFFDSCIWWTPHCPRGDNATW